MRARPLRRALLGGVVLVATAGGALAGGLPILGAINLGPYALTLLGENPTPALGGNAFTLQVPGAPPGAVLRATLTGPDGRSRPLNLVAFGQVSLHGNQANMSALNAAGAAPGPAQAAPGDNSMPGMDMSDPNAMPGVAARASAASSPKPTPVTPPTSGVEAVLGHSHGPAFTWRGRATLTPGAWRLGLNLSDGAGGRYSGALTLNPKDTSPSRPLLGLMLAVTLGALAYGRLARPPQARPPLARPTKARPFNREPA